MEFKTIDDFDFKSKKVLLRVDLNAEIIKNKVILSDRIIEHAKTIKELLKKKARVVVISHQGRPSSKDFINLKQHARLLNKFVKISFIDDIIGKKAINAIRNLKDGEAILLDNVRFLKEEFTANSNNNFVKVLSSEVDFFINDALSISHRVQTSVVSFPKVLPSCIGRVMQHELENIKKVNTKDSLFILGGMKVEDIMLLVNKGKILSTGVFSLLCLIASGYDLGLENYLLKKDLKFIPEIKKHLNNIKIPVDLAADVNNKRKDMVLKEFPNKFKVLDIGKETIKFYEKEIIKAKSIFWKGTAGYCESKKFSLGTKKLLKAIEKSNAFCVVAGGHSSDALNRLGINKKKIGYISLSGGALIYLVAGKKLPGLEALKK